MKSLGVYLKHYKKESIIAPLFKLLEVVFDLLVPMVVAQIIDVGIAGNNRPYIVSRFGILVLMAAVGLCCSFTAQYFAAKASVGCATELRQAVFDHIQALSFTELDTIGTDTLITRLINDINQVQNGINMGLRLLLRSPFIVFGSVVMAFTVNVKCAIVFLVTIPILFVAVFGIMLVSIPLFKKVQAALDRVTGMTRENLNGVRVIRAFCREEQSVADFEKSNDELTCLNEFVGKISALLNPLTYVLINIAAVVLIWQAGLQVNIGSMQQGQVVALYNYMLQIIVELIKLASLIITLNKSVACAERVSGVLAVPTTMNYPAKGGAAKKVTGDAAVTFKNVSFTYAGAGAESLSDISFTAKRGQTIGIIGGTGSAKSSLVNLISRLYDVTNGSVLVGGIDVRKYHLESLRNQVSVVLQKNVLFSGTILENLRWGDKNATEEECRRACQLACADDFIEKMPDKYNTFIEQGGSNVSGGQKQRLCIARALLKKPKILILDDSTSAVDTATDARIRRAFAEEIPDTTKLIIAQRVSSIQNADRIIVMDNGEINGFGTHEELLKTNAIYQEVFHSQTGGAGDFDEGGEPA